MRVRIRLSRGPTVHRKRSKDRQLALALAALLTPAALMATALALWRLGADLKWTGEFAISDGLFSHWQVWFAMAVVLQLAAIVLNRYGREDGATTS
jgi:hypothetical protein